MPENWEVLNAKLDFVLQKLSELEKHQNAISEKQEKMQDQWSQSQGVLRFIKFCSIIAVSFAALWGVFHHTLH